MLKNAAVILPFILLVSCGGTETWIPIAANRPAVTRVHVQYLENPPQRPHIGIGIITPPSGEYETEAEAVKAMRKEAAKHGVDAIFIESATKEGGWRFGFSRFGGKAIASAMFSAASSESRGCGMNERPLIARRKALLRRH